MDDQKNLTEAEAKQLSRRGFLKDAAVIAAGLSVASIAAACQTTPATPTPLLAGEGELQPNSPQNYVPLENPDPGKLVLAQQYPEVPFTPAEPPDPSILRFFTPDEAELVDALASRILPGTPDDPGAHEAGVVTYIDNYLSYFGGLVTPTYTHPPYAIAYEGDSPPGDRQGSYQVVYVKKDEFPRYGMQSIMTPAEKYRLGLAGIEAYVKQNFDGTKFTDLSSDQQDQIVGDLANGNVDTLTNPSSHDFFSLLRSDVMQGMFADEVYGGNRGLVGWKLVGYPGSQRAYTPYDIHDENFHREPQSIVALMPFRPGQPSGPDVILPVSGFDQQPK